MLYSNTHKLKKKLQYIFKTYGVSKVIINKVNKAIDDVAADVVEVVRCKDCNFRGTEDCPRWYYLELVGDYVDPTEDDDFCSYGERKDNDTERSD